jgi:hypothetical protein
MRLGFGGAVVKCVPVGEPPIDIKQLPVVPVSIPVVLRDAGLGVDFANRKTILTDNQISLWKNERVFNFRRRLKADSADSDDVDQSNRFDADQIGAKRRKTLSV